MDLTSLAPPEKRVLRALFELAQRSHPAQPDVLARALDQDHSAVKRTLDALAVRGLVDAVRVRLTLAGLAVAVRVPVLERAALVALGAWDADDRPQRAPEPAWRAGGCLERGLTRRSGPGRAGFRC